MELNRGSLIVIAYHLHHVVTPTGPYRRGANHLIDDGDVFQLKLVCAFSACTAGMAAVKATETDYCPIIVVHFEAWEISGKERHVDSHH